MLAVEILQTGRGFALRALSLMPGGLARSSSGLPWPRKSVPWYAAGMKPLRSS